MIRERCASQITASRLSQYIYMCTKERVRRKNASSDEIYTLTSLARTHVQQTRKITAQLLVTRRRQNYTKEIK